MDVAQALRDAENSLRDFISLLLSQRFGLEWINHTGVSDDRIARWEERRAAEAKRQPGGVAEERLLYYADFYDLKTILKKHWAECFAAALGEWRTFDVYLSELEKLRDPDAHRRELLPHQKHLIIGISGEIRNRIVRFRSSMETSDDCFPRIESVRDSLGHIWVPKGEFDLKRLNTEATLRPGDVLDIVVTASDPEETPLEYAMGVGHATPDWQTNGDFQFRVEEMHVRRHLTVSFFVRSGRDYHAATFYDDSVDFVYSVLPRRPG